MYPYHIAQVCTSGHLITDCFDVLEYERRNFCPKCGAPTITKCPACGSEIYGAIEGSRCDTTVDAYCGFCGTPFPWTSAALQSAKAIIEEAPELSDELKANTSGSLSDILVETPGTNLAIVRLKKVLQCAEKFTCDALRQFVIDFGCELAKRSLLP